ncbi:hypothetical protein BGZ49_005167 [Haplosporangium sp. Z 27]|nr:hypothetical protein BGZ49_005167 [Haplosporangium sp. Z 27]
MVEPEPESSLNPVAADVNQQLKITGDGRQGTQSFQSTQLTGSSLSSSSSHMNTQQNTEHEGELHQLGGAHGAAAMALTALSSGVGVGTTTKSGFLTTAENTLRATQKNQSSASETLMTSTPVTSESAISNLEKSSALLPFATIDQASDMEQEAHTIRRGVKDYQASPVVVGSLYPRQHGIIEHTRQTISMSSTLPNSIISSFDSPLDGSATSSLRPSSQVPGERMHTLSHMLKDQLSLVSSRFNQDREENHAGLDEPNLTQYNNEFTIRDSVEDSRSTRHHSRANSSRGSYNLKEISYSPPVQHLSSTMEPDTFKPKRKYTKKSTYSPSALESPSQETSKAVQEGELLQSDRGLILKTQIPKKGRPISKHSSISQSTPTLSSLGVLPASHPYFSPKTGISLSSSLFASAPLRPLDSKISHSTAHQRDADCLHHANTTMNEIQPQTPIRRRPGRPPLAATITKHAHSQSYSSLQVSHVSISSPQSHSTGTPNRDFHGRLPPPYRAPSPSISIQSSIHTTRQNKQLLSESQHHNAAFQAENEYSGKDQYYEKPSNNENFPSQGLSSLLESEPIQSKSHKRDSYGAEKRKSTEDHSHLEDERRSISSAYGMDGQQGNYLWNQSEHGVGGRSKKRYSGTEKGFVELETNIRDGNEAVQKWRSYDSEHPHPRPRSLFLSRGSSDSSLHLHLVNPTAGTELHRLTGKMDNDKESQLYNRESRDSAMPTSQDIAHRSLHSHARSLDLSSRFDHHTHPQASHAQDSQAPFGPRSGSDSHLYSQSTSSSPLPVPIHRDNHDATQSYLNSDIDYQGHEVDSLTMTRAERLAHEMSEGGRKSGNGTVSAHMKTYTKRSSKRGPGPYLKKHQILQQQLQQMQREQEEMEVQIAAQQHQELYERQQRYLLESSGRPNQLQHSRHISMDQEFNPRHYQQYQSQPGHPPKQRALVRSESASSAIHGLQYPSGSMSQTNLHQGNRYIDHYMHLI